MKILSKLDNTGMIDEVTDKRYVTDAEKSTWNSKSDTDTVTTVNGKTGAISKADIVALGIPSQDTNTTYSEITTAEIDTGTASTLRTITGRRVKYILDKVQGWISGLTKSDVGLSNVDNVKQATKVEFDEHKDDLEKHITSFERINWNSKGVENLGTFNDEGDLIGHITTNQLPTGHYAFIMSGYPTFISLKELQDSYSIALYYHDGVILYFESSLSGEVLDMEEVELIGLPTYAYIDSQDSKQMPISGGVLGNYSEQLVTLSGTSTTIDLSLANVFAHSLTGNTTYSITNAVNGQAHSFTLIVVMGSTVRTVTFPASVKWQGGEIPDMSAPNKTYILTFMTIDGGTNWLGMFGGLSDVNFKLPPPLAQDDDFSGTTNGAFKYVGTAASLTIPRAIKGVPVTSYANMFNGSSVIRVASYNKNVTNMNWMFASSSATTLDLSDFDTSNVTSMDFMFRGSRATTLDLSSFDTSNVRWTYGMFEGSSATTGYARTQADADKLNASTLKPGGLTFIVKP